MDSIFVVFVGIHLYASTKRHLLHNFSSSAIRYNNVHPTMKGCPSPMDPDPFVKYRAPQQKRKLGRRPGRTRRRRVTFMSCPASAGAAETANGAVERMVLLGLTGVYYIIFAAITVRTKSNPPRNLPRRSFSEGGTAAQLAAPFPLAPIVHLAISSQRWCAGPGILTLRQCPKTSVEIYSC